MSDLRPVDTKFIDKLKTNFNSVDSLSLTPQPFLDDWYSVDYRDYTYVTDNQISADAIEIAKYSVGDILKIEQSSTKYFVIYRKTSTDLYLYGGNTYTFDNSAFTSIQTSKRTSPDGFDFRFPDTLSASTNGTMTVSGSTTAVVSFEGMKVNVNYKISVSTSGTLQSTLRIENPIKAKTTNSLYFSGISNVAGTVSNIDAQVLEDYVLITRLAGNFGTATNVIYLNYYFYNYYG